MAMATCVLTWRSWFSHVEDKLLGELLGILGFLDKVVDVGS